MGIRMSGLNFKNQILFCLMLLSLALKAENDDIEMPDKKNFLKKITPAYTKAQYAGGMGMFSLGLGWEYAKKRLESDLIVGMAPSSYSFSGYDAKLLYVLTMKQNYYPWRLRFKNQVLFEPLTISAYATILMNKDEELWMFPPSSRYGNGYYWHSSRVRFHLSVGERISFHLKKSKTAKVVSLFYEIGTCDLYLVDAINGNEYTFYDLLMASVGIRFSIK